MANGNRIDKGTLIPLALVISLVLSFSGGAVWINGTLQALKFEITSLRAEVNTLQTSINNSWTEDNMKHWIELLRVSNPDLDVPGID